MTVLTKIGKFYLCKLETADIEILRPIKFIHGKYVLLQVDSPKTLSDTIMCLAFVNSDNTYQSYNEAYTSALLVYYRGFYQEVKHSITDIQSAVETLENLEISKIENDAPDAQWLTCKYIGSKNDTVPHLVGNLVVLDKLSVYIEDGITYGKVVPYDAPDEVYTIRLCSLEMI